MLTPPLSARLAVACSLAVAATLLATPRVAAQDAPAAPTDESVVPADEPAFSQAELDQMLAPIALYPDELLSQILMATTYPMEVLEAHRWVEANPDLEGDALTKALEAKSWDPSVKSLVNFPDLLASFDENLEWTRKIGDAFLADQKTVMDTVQGLRKRAKDEGNLESTEQMDVKTETEEGAPTEQVIVIESKTTEVIYVPAYNPVVVYGTWWWPGFPPPVYWRPPYWRPAPVIVFGRGFAVGVAWGYAWGRCRWHHHSVNINVNRNVNINRNIDRNRYRTQADRNGGEWRHDPQHRKGAEYRDRATASRYGGETSRDRSKARENYRGRAQADRQQLDRNRASGRIDSTGRASGGGPGAARQRDANRSGTNRSGTDRSSRSRGSNQRGGAVSGTSRGSSARRDSQRGRTSRSRPPASGGSRGRTSVPRRGRGR